MTDKNLLVEECLFEYKISEATESDKGLKKLRGLFQKANARNANGRVYTIDILKREVDKLQESIQNRRLVGQLDHPTSATIEFTKASHLVNQLVLEESGDCLGEIELLPTPAGKIANALVDSQVQIGISSRGLGTVRKDGDLLVVNDDFQLVTFDLVAEPSTPGAYPTPISEDIIRRILNKDTKPANFKRELHKLIDELVWKR